MSGGRLLWRFGESTAFCGYLILIMGWSWVAYALLCMFVLLLPDYLDQCGATSPSP